MSDKIIRVSDIMQTSLHMVEGLASVQEAIEKMGQHKISSLVIERRDENDEYGVITIQDIADKVVALNRSTQRTSVYEIMTKPALTLDPKMNVKYATRLLARLNLGRALVSEGDGLMGFVNLRDLVLSYSEQK